MNGYGQTTTPMPRAMTLLERVAVMEKEHANVVECLRRDINQLQEQVQHLERELGTRWSDTPQCAPPEDCKSY